MTLGSTVKAVAGLLIGSLSDDDGNENPTKQWD